MINDNKAGAPNPSDETGAPASPAGLSKKPTPDAGEDDARVTGDIETVDAEETADERERPVEGDVRDDSDAK